MVERQNKFRVDDGTRQQRLASLSIQNSQSMRDNAIRMSRYNVQLNQQIQEETSRRARIQKKLAEQLKEKQDYVLSSSQMRDLPTPDFQLNDSLTAVIPLPALTTYADQPPYTPNFILASDIDTGDQFQRVQNRLQEIREALLTQNKVFPDEPNKYTTNLYGIRTFVPQYRQTIRDKIERKAFAEKKSDLISLINQVNDRVGQEQGTRDVLAKFNDALVNEKGQLLLGNSLVAWKKFMKSNFNEDEVRHPVTLLAKRIVQYKRAVAQLASYISKGKSIAKSIDLRNNPERILARRYAKLKNLYKAYANDDNRRTLGYDYKVRAILDKQAARRETLLTQNNSDIIANQIRAYDNAMEFRTYLKGFKARAGNA